MTIRKAKEAIQHVREYGGETQEHLERRYGKGSIPAEYYMVLALVDIIGALGLVYLDRLEAQDKETSG